MNRLIRFLSVCLLLSFVFPVQAKVEGVTNEPNQVYLFSYSNRDGRSGLKFAWSPDGEKWFSVADGFAYVNSDFGPWGRAKTMFKPHLMQTRADGKALHLGSYEYWSGTCLCNLSRLAEVGSTELFFSRRT